MRNPSIEQAKVRVAQWVARRRHVVLYDEENSTLLDVASGKTTTLAWRDVKAVEEKVHPETEEPYLVLLFESGVQMALVSPGGVAFSPSEMSTGPLRDLPQVVCLKDFHTLKGRVDHYLFAHRDEPPPKECLELVKICIAILDGARLVGFDVGELERELDSSLRQIERRSAQTTC